MDAALELADRQPEKKKKAEHATPNSIEYTSRLTQNTDLEGQDDGEKR